MLEALAIVCGLQALGLLAMTLAIVHMGMTVARQWAGSRKDRDYLLWQLRKLRSELDALDATVAEHMELAERIRTR